MDKLGLKDVSINYALEDYMTVSRVAQEVSTEGFIDFLKKLAGGWGELFKPQVEMDGALKRALMKAPEAKRVLKVIDNTVIGRRTFITPASFKGNFNEFMDDLIVSYQHIADLTNRNVQALSGDLNRMIQAGELTTTPKSIVSIREGVKARQVHANKVKGYFLTPKSKSHSLILECFRSPQEIDEFFDKISTLGQLFQKFPIEQINANVDVLSEILDNYIDELEARGGNIRNDKGVKEITESLYNLSLDIEFCGVIQAYGLQSYASAEALSYVFSNVRHR